MDTTQIRPLLLDFDGTLADTRRANTRAYVAALTEAGYPLTEQEYEANYFGMRCEEFLTRLGIADPAERREAALAAIRASLGGCGDLFGFFRDKTLRFWGEYEESWLGVADEYIHTLRNWDRIFFMAASALALTGCLSRGESAAESLARGTVFANFTVYLFIEVQPRYRHFVWPFLIILAAAGVKRLSAAYGHLRRKLL